MIRAEVPTGAIRRSIHATEEASARVELCRWPLSRMERLQLVSSPPAFCYCRDDRVADHQQPNLRFISKMEPPRRS